MPGLFLTGKLVSLAQRDSVSCIAAREKTSNSKTLGGIASSIIAVGLSWRMAIGACVLGNAVMGIIITVNGRMGAKVSRINDQTLREI